MIKVNLQNVSAPTSIFEAVKAENPDVLKGILCAEVNGKVVGLSEEISENGEIILYDFSDSEGKKTYWHTGIIRNGICTASPFPCILV